MQRYLLNHLSSGEFILLLVCTIFSIALLISYLTEKYLHSFIENENKKYIEISLASIGANYGFVLGFIIVMLWKDLNDVKSYVSQEAEYLSLLVFNASTFPEAIQNDILNAIEQYIRIVIQDEWPLMRIGQASEKSLSVLRNIFHIMQSYVPETRIEQIFFDQFIKDLNKVVEFRTRRLEYLDSSLIDIIRFMLLFGVLVILFLLSLLDASSPTLKKLSLFLVSGILSFNLGLAFLLDYPFSGISATPEPFTKGVLNRYAPVIVPQ